MATQRLTGYRRPDGRVGIRNHVVILPVDDLSNAAAESVARAIPGTLAHPAPVWAAAVRRRPGSVLPDHDRHRGEPERRRGRGHRHRAGLDGADRGGHRAQPASRSRSSPSSGTATCAVLEMASRRAAQLLQDASELPREPVERGELLMSIKCGESDTTSGLGANPATSVGGRPAHRGRRDGDLRRDHRADRGRAPHRRALRHRRGSQEVPGLLRRLLRHGRADRRQPARLAADPGQHPRRAVHHRGEGAGQHPEDRRPRRWSTRWPRPSGPPGPG